MSAETLRRAAELIRARAEAATGDIWGWRHFGDDPESMCRVVYYPPRPSVDWRVIADDIWGPDDAAHIASWHPAVALAVAEWLDIMAEDYAPYWAEPYAAPFVPVIERAYRVARAYLGAEES